VRALLKVAVGESFLLTFTIGFDQIYGTEFVYDPRTGLEAAVGTFGGGDPYDGLRWYELTLAQ